MKLPLLTTTAALLAAQASALPHAPRADSCSTDTGNSSATATCTRDSLTDLVAQVLASMESQSPYTLPLAPLYRATENSHPAALSMMTLWRTVTSAPSPPSLLAIDTTNCTAYFALAITESSGTEQSLLRARIAVDPTASPQELTELELYITRSRGDHGFSFSAADSAANYAAWMSPPANATMPSRADLLAIGAASFDASDALNVTVASDCDFLEEGWHVIDAGPDGDGSTDPLGCAWRSDRPSDLNARNALVVDETLGLVVTAGIIPGTVYPYGNVSAFIPDDMVEAQETQDEWLEEKLADDEANVELVNPDKATGETVYVFQYYNGELQGHQINVHLAGPGMESVWTQEE